MAGGGGAVKWLEGGRDRRGEAQARALAQPDGDGGVDSGRVSGWRGDVRFLDVTVNCPLFLPASL